MDGNQIDHGRFLVLQGQHIIRWMSAEKPQRVAVIIKLTKELALKIRDRQVEETCGNPAICSHNCGGIDNRPADLLVQAPGPSG